MRSASRQLEFLLLLMAVSVISGQETYAQGPINRQYELRAAWLYHFGNSLIEWDESVGDEFVIGVFGAYPGDMERHLRRIGELEIQGMPVRIEHYRKIQDFDEDDAPAILFISSVVTDGETMRMRIDAAEKVTEGDAVVMVGETRDHETRTAISFRVNNADQLLKLRFNELPDGVQLGSTDVWDELRNDRVVEDVSRPTAVETSSRD